MQCILRLIIPLLPIQIPAQLRIVQRRLSQLAKPTPDLKACIFDNRVRRPAVALRCGMCIQGSPSAALNLPAAHCFA